jgi:hypothetical protein
LKKKKRRELQVIEGVIIEAIEGKGAGVEAAIEPGELNKKKEKKKTNGKQTYKRGRRRRERRQESKKERTKTNNNKKKTIHTLGSSAHWKGNGYAADCLCLARSESSFASLRRRFQPQQKSEGQSDEEKAIEKSRLVKVKWAENSCVGGQDLI